MFAKLYGTDEDQILVLRQEIWESHEQAGEIRVFTVPSEPPGLGVCSLAIQFSDTDEGWKRLERCFDNFNEDMAFAFAERIKAGAKGEDIQ